MRIKTLEMRGFKSFADRTVINFEDGITGVVGPNGCGKSNIVDAIRWVMGEMSAKHLRGSAMEDVIFNGCESRPGVGMAQVSLTFDNSDGRAPAEFGQYSVIEIGRVLYRSGESEYFINKTPCRHKDVVDFFLGTGVGTKAYSIVEQGMVGSIISSKPEDRRMLIEEAAGISKFKARKEAALRKMESTRQNLARLTDVISEITRQTNSLNRQAKKAERFKELSDELRGRELTLAATKYRAMKDELENLESEHLRIKEVEVSTSAELSTFEAEMENKRISVAELERELESASEDLFKITNSIKLAESEIGHKNRESANLTEQTKTDAEELATLRARLGDIAARIESANSAMVSADLSLAGSEDVTKVAEDEAFALKSEHASIQNECEIFTKRVMESSREIANLSASLDHLERRKIDINGRIAKNQSELDGIDERRKNIESELSAKASELDGAQQMKLSLDGEAESALSLLAEQREQLGAVEEKVRSLKDEVSDRRSRLDAILELRKNLEGYRDGVRAVLKREDGDGAMLKGVLGTVGELFETSAEFEPALGAVLGEKLQYVVVRSHEEGVEAIDYLRSASCGRGTFVPVGVRASESASEAPEGEGVVGRLQNFVRFSDEYKQIGQYLLGDVVLVDNLPRALELWGGGSTSHTFVTKDGCVVDNCGVVSGGAQGGVEEQLIAQKRRARELEEELSALKNELANAEGEALMLRERVSAVDARVKQLGRDSHSEELRLLGQQRDVERMRDEVTRYERERDKLTVETAALAEELAEIEKEREENSSRLEQSKREQSDVEMELATKRTFLEDVGTRLSNSERRLMEIKVGLAKDKERASQAGRELLNLVRDKADAQLQISRRLHEINSANGRVAMIAREITSIRFDLDVVVREAKRLEELQLGLRSRYDAESTVVRESELRLREIRKRHESALSCLHDIDLRLTQFRSKFEYLVQGIFERYRLDIAAVHGDYAADELDVSAEEIAVDDLKSRIDKIGPVNVDAIDEFRELSERQEFLAKQYEDLTSSLDNLTKAISKINRTSRQRFRRAFDAVDSQFQELFPKLFRGGQARLMLTDEENILESGVEIIAQPPGKKLQSITLLSGGEKALTAVALIFSIFLIKPSPFCLLDEVDAPLDDANIDRFNDLIRSMVSHSQFILITHNKRTMEMGDVLYGVTMEEAGVSKLVSVRLGQDKKVEQVA